MTSPIALRAGAASAIVHPDSGGRLGQLDLGRGPVLREWEPGLGWAEWGCYPLLPWSNRIPDGHLAFGEIDARLKVNWADRSAIHGLVASCAWTVAASSKDRAELIVEAVATPYHIRGRQTLVLEPGRMHLGLSVVNLGDAPVPVGLGIHPWFHAGPIRLPATLKWPGDPIPVGAPIPVERSDDFRTPRVPPVMDRCFTGLTDTSADVPGVTLSWKGPITQIVVYSGTPGWVAVEPVTMANDGIGLAQRGTPGHGVQRLEPTCELSVTYHFGLR